ncbi:MAG: carboxypeptidase-like regulatory domain-containing protein [Gemmatimonadota bacterium]|nr:carboxypeptidase-like regulatory domain-containing protein [Gemmatimonadota bacterium]
MNARLRVRAVGRTLAVMSIVPLRLLAQRDETARLTGTITEHVASRPVQMVSLTMDREGAEGGASFNTRPDANGHYHIDSIPAGRYLAHVTSPLLDSLELALPEREVSLALGQTTILDYTLPHGAALRDAMCPGLMLSRGKAVVAGHAADADTDQPMADAEVVVAWSELVVDRSTMATSTLEHAASVKTGGRGEYRLCGVPTGTLLLVQLQHGARAGTAVHAMVSDDEGAVVRDLSLSARSALPLAALDSLERLAQTVGVNSVTGELLRVGTASVTGTVRGAAGVPLAGAQVRVQDARASTITDSTGRYFLGALPEGTQVLLVRQLGYALAEQPVELRSGRSVTREVQLVRAATLDTIVVSEYRTRYREFEFNRGMYIIAGDFLTAGMIARRKPLPETGDLVDRMPGFHVVGHGSAAKVFTKRALERNSRCEANVVVDGVEQMGVNDVPPNSVQGIEAYVTPPKPPVYHREGCGLIVIWSRNWRRPTRPMPVVADSSGRLYR